MELKNLLRKYSYSTTVFEQVWLKLIDSQDYIEGWALNKITIYDDVKQIVKPPKEPL